MFSFTRITRFWQRITEPHQHLVASEHQNEARTLAGMCLSILAISGIGVVLTFGSYRFDEIRYLLPILACIFFYLIPYELSRRGYIRFAALLMALMALLLIGSAALIMGQYSGQNLGQNILHYLVLVPLFSAAFLSLDYTIIFSLSIIATCIIYGLANPTVPFNEIMRGPLIYNGFSACFATLATEFWRRREIKQRLLLLTAEEQRHQLLIKQERYTILKTFIEATTHDFGTRLSQIETNRYFVRKKILAGGTLETVDPHLEKIRLVIRQIADQLNNLGKIANLDNPLRSQVNLATIVQAIAHDIAPLVHQQRLHLEITAPDTQAYCDDVQIQLALYHLVNNALTYTPPGGTLRLQTRSTETHGLLIVEDTGKGIAEQDLTHIFEAFYKADSARTTTTSGLGLGLTVVRLIAEANDGIVEVRSSIGIGSTFTLLLPRQAKTALAN